MIEQVVTVESRSVKLKLNDGLMAGLDLDLETPGTFRAYGRVRSLCADPNKYYSAIDIIDTTLLTFGDILPDMIGNLVFAGIIIMSSDQSLTGQASLGGAQMLCLEGPVFNQAFAVNPDESVLPTAGDWVLVPLLELTILGKQPCGNSPSFKDTDHLKHGFQRAIAHLIECNRYADYARLLISTVQPVAVLPIGTGGGDEEPEKFYSNGQMNSETMNLVDYSSDDGGLEPEPEVVKKARIEEADNFLKDKVGFIC